MSDFDTLGKHIGEIDSVVDAWIARLGLGYNHFAVLYSLAVTPDGACTQKQICDDWYLAKQTVFNICKEYRERGWIEFGTSPHDKRERILHLTALGKTHATPVVEQTQAVFGQALNKFGAQKTAQLFALMSEFSQVCQNEVKEYEIKN